MTAKVLSDLDILRALQESPWETLMRECAARGEAAQSANEPAPARRGSSNTRSKKQVARDVPAPRPSTPAL
jgi:hypothetical protein